MVASGFRARFVRGADFTHLRFATPARTPLHDFAPPRRSPLHKSGDSACYARAAPSDFDGPQCALSLWKRDQLLRRASRETANEMFKGATS